jgi:3-oxoacyl-[acyl-carrier protein] reductase
LSSGYPEAFLLTDRIAVVTGAGSGIGRGIAQVYGEAGAHVVCADVSSDGAAKTAEAIVAAGGRASTATVDISVRDQMFGLMQDTAAEHGRLDVLCNNAGILGPNKPILDITEDDLDGLMAINLKGALFGCQAAIPIMTGQGGGTIVNVASAAIDFPTPEKLCYSMSKAAVVQLTRAVARSYGPQGVRANVLAPGGVDTAITALRYTNPDGSIDEEKRQAIVSSMAAASPLGHAATPEDMGWAALWLAVDASRNLTGQILRSTGGGHMPW